MLLPDAAALLLLASAGTAPFPCSAWASRLRSFRLQCHTRVHAVFLRRCRRLRRHGLYRLPLMRRQRLLPRPLFSSALVIRVAVASTTVGHTVDSMCPRIAYSSVSQSGRVPSCMQWHEPSQSSTWKRVLTKSHRRDMAGTGNRNRVRLGARPCLICCF